MDKDMLWKSRSQNKNLKDAEKRGAFRIWKEPLIHFFVLGMVVFGLHSVFETKPESSDDPFLVEVSSADIEWFRTMWTKQMGREPTVEELRGQVNQMIREQILSREAVSMGLDEGDMVIRRRLTQKMNFLFKDLSDISEPSESELQAFLQENRSAYEIPQKVTFSHIYFNTDKRGENEAADAILHLSESLNTNEEFPSNVSALGDPFLLSSSYSNKAVAEIRESFGPKFVKAVREQEIRAWKGPVVSGYGLHAVYVHERSEAELPDFSDLKERLEADWMSEKQRQLARKAYENLRGRYQVLLEGMPYELDVSG